MYHFIFLNLFKLKNILVAVCKNNMTFMSQDFAKNWWNRWYLWHADG